MAITLMWHLHYMYVSLCVAWPWLGGQSQCGKPAHEGNPPSRHSWSLLWIHVWRPFCNSAPYTWFAHYLDNALHSHLGTWFVAHTEREQFWCKIWMSMCHVCAVTWDYKGATSTLKRGTPPQKGDRPLHELGTRGRPQEGTFHFASHFTWERTIIAKSDNDVYEGSCVLSPCTNL